MNEQIASTVSYLVVDDDTVFRTRLVLALRDRGNTVLEAESVESALTTITRHAIDRVILDLSMPGGSGLLLLEELHSRFPSVGPKVLVLTGYGSIATATKAMKLGAINYATKPTSVSDILLYFEDIVPEVDPTSETEVPSLTQVEWDHLQRVMTRCDGNITKAAKLLNMHRRTLQRKLQKSPGRIK